MNAQPIYALNRAIKTLPDLLAAEEASGDHDHGRGPIHPGHRCSGGDCSVAEARAMITGRLLLAVLKEAFPTLAHNGARPCSPTSCDPACRVGIARAAITAAEGV